MREDRDGDEVPGDWDSLAFLLLSDRHHPTSDDGAGEGCAQKVDILQSDDNR